MTKKYKRLDGEIVRWITLYWLEEARRAGLELHEPLKIELESYVATEGCGASEGSAKGGVL